MTAVGDALRAADARIAPASCLGRCSDFMIFFSADLKDIKLLVKCTDDPGAHGADKIIGVEAIRANLFAVVAIDSTRQR